MPACPHGLGPGECQLCELTALDPVTGPFAAEDPEPPAYEYVGPGPAPARGICRVCRERYAEGAPVVARLLASSGVPFGYLHPECQP